MRGILQGVFALGCSDHNIVGQIGKKSGRWGEGLCAPVLIAPVLFAGIAPGMIGIYQMDVTIPQGYPSSLATLECFDQSNSGLVGDYTTMNIVSGR